MASPFFSIIIPTYNAGAKLAKSLDSALGQRETPLEILILDGGSTDETVPIIEAYAKKYPDVIRWQSEKDKGVYDAMNKGIDLAQGKYLYFLGAGDTLREGVLNQVEALAPKEGIAFLYGDVNWIGRDPAYAGEFTKARMAYLTPCHQAIFYERSIFDALGRYDTRYKIAADWVQNMKCFGRRDIAKVYLGIVVADYEGGGLSVTSTDAAFERDRRQLIRECLRLGPARYAFFLVEQWLAQHIAGSRALVPRKFWHLQLWILHNAVRPLLGSENR